MSNFCCNDDFNQNGVFDAFDGFLYDVFITECLTSADGCPDTTQKLLDAYSNSKKPPLQYGLDHLPEFDCSDFNLNGVFDAFDGFLYDVFITECLTSADGCPDTTQKLLDAYSNSKKPPLQYGLDHLPRLTPTGCVEENCVPEFLCIEEPGNGSDIPPNLLGIAGTYEHSQYSGDLGTDVSWGRLTDYLGNKKPSDNAGGLYNQGTPEDPNWVYSIADWGYTDYVLNNSGGSPLAGHEQFKFYDSEENETDCLPNATFVSFRLDWDKKIPIVVTPTQCPPTLCTFEISNVTDTAPTGDEDTIGTFELTIVLESLYSYGTSDRLRAMEVEFYGIELAKENAVVATTFDEWKDDTEKSAEERAMWSELSDRSQTILSNIGETDEVRNKLMFADLRETVTEGRGFDMSSHSTATLTFTLSYTTKTTDYFYATSAGFYDSTATMNEFGSVICYPQTPTPSPSPSPSPTLTPTPTVSPTPTTTPEFCDDQIVCIMEAYDLYGLTGNYMRVDEESSMETGVTYIAYESEQEQTYDDTLHAPIKIKQIGSFKSTTWQIQKTDDNKIPWPINERLVEYLDMDLTFNDDSDTPIFCLNELNTISLVPPTTTIAQSSHAVVTESGDVWVNGQSNAGHIYTNSYVSSNPLGIEIPHSQWDRFATWKSFGFGGDYFYGGGYDGDPAVFDPYQKIGISNVEKIRLDSASSAGLQYDNAITGMLMQTSDGKIHGTGHFKTNILSAITEIPDLAGLDLDMLTTAFVCYKEDGVKKGSYAFVYIDVETDNELVYKIPVYSTISNSEFTEKWEYLYKRSPEYKIQGNMPFVSEYKTIRSGIKDVTKFIRYYDVCFIQKQEQKLYMHGEFKTVNIKHPPAGNYGSFKYMGVVHYQDDVFDESGVPILSEVIDAGFIMPHEKFGSTYEQADLHSFIEEEYYGPLLNFDAGGLQHSYTDDVSDYRVLSLDPGVNAGQPVANWAHPTLGLVLVDPTTSVNTPSEIYVQWPDLISPQESTSPVSVTNSAFSGILSHLTDNGIDIKSYYSYSGYSSDAEEHPIETWSIISTDNTLYMCRLVEDYNGNNLTQLNSDDYDVGDWVITEFSDITSYESSTTQGTLAHIDTSGARLHIAPIWGVGSFFGAKIWNTIGEPTLGRVYAFVNTSGECDFPDVPTPTPSPTITPTFTPTPTPLPCFDEEDCSDVTLLLSSNENDPHPVIDYSTKLHDVKQFGVSLASDEKKFGDASIKFNGDSDYLRVTSADPTSESFQIGTGDFTLETWFKLIPPPPSGCEITTPIEDIKLCLAGFTKTQYNTTWSWSENHQSDPPWSSKPKFTNASGDQIVWKADTPPYWSILGTDGSVLRSADSSHSYPWCVDWSEHGTVELNACDQPEYNPATRQTIVTSHDAWTLYYDIDENEFVFEQTGSEIKFKISYEVQDDAWCHVAVMRNASKMSFYVNGVLLADPVDNALDYANSDVLFIGAYPVSETNSGQIVTGHHLGGWIDQLRFIHGHARYLYDPNFECNFNPKQFGLYEREKASLCLRLEDNYADSSSSNIHMKIDKSYSGLSHFNSNESIHSNENIEMSDEFTLSFRVRFEEKNDGVIFHTGDLSQQLTAMQLSVLTEGSRKLRLEYADREGILHTIDSTDILHTSINTEWNFIRIVGSLESNTIELYVNGSLVGDDDNFIGIAKSRSDSQSISDIFSTHQVGRSNGHQDGSLTSWSTMENLWNLDKNPNFEYNTSTNEYDYALKTGSGLPRGRFRAGYGRNSQFELTFRNPISILAGSSVYCAYSATRNSHYANGGASIRVASHEHPRTRVRNGGCSYTKIYNIQGGQWVSGVVTTCCVGIST